MSSSELNRLREKVRRPMVSSDELSDTTDEDTNSDSQIKGKKKKSAEKKAPLFLNHFKVPQTDIKKFMPKRRSLFERALDKYKKQCNVPLVSSTPMPNRTTIRPDSGPMFSPIPNNIHPSRRRSSRKEVAGDNVELEDEYRPTPSKRVNRGVNKQNNWLKDLGLKSVYDNYTKPAQENDIRTSKSFGETQKCISRSTIRDLPQCSISLRRKTVGTNTSAGPDVVIIPTKAKETVPPPKTTNAISSKSVTTTTHDMLAQSTSSVRKTVATNTSAGLDVIIIPIEETTDVVLPKSATTLTREMASSSKTYDLLAQSSSNRKTVATNTSAGFSVRKSTSETAPKTHDLLERLTSSRRKTVATNTSAGLDVVIEPTIMKETRIDVVPSKCVTTLTRETASSPKMRDVGLSPKTEDTACSSSSRVKSKRITRSKKQKSTLVKSVSTAEIVEEIISEVNATTNSDVMTGQRESSPTKRTPIVTNQRDSSPSDRRQAASPIKNNATACLIKITSPAINDITSSRTESSTKKTFRDVTNSQRETSPTKNDQLVTPTSFMPNEMSKVHNTRAKVSMKELATSTNQESRLSTRKNSTSKDKTRTTRKSKRSNAVSPPSEESSSKKNEIKLRFVFTDEIEGIVPLDESVDVTQTRSISSQKKKTMNHKSQNGKNLSIPENGQDHLPTEVPKAVSPNKKNLSRSSIGVVETLKERSQEHSRIQVLEILKETSQDHLSVRETISQNTKSMDQDHLPIGIPDVLDTDIVAGDIPAVTDVGFNKTKRKTTGKRKTSESQAENRKKKKDTERQMEEELAFCVNYFAGINNFMDGPSRYNRVRRKRNIMVDYCELTMTTPLKISPKKRGRKPKAKVTLKRINETSPVDKAQELKGNRGRLLKLQNVQVVIDKASAIPEDVLFKRPSTPINTKQTELNDSGLMSGEGTSEFRPDSAVEVENDAISTGFRTDSSVNLNAGTSSTSEFSLIGNKRNKYSLKGKIYKSLYADGDKQIASLHDISNASWIQKDSYSLLDTLKASFLSSGFMRLDKGATKAWAVSKHSNLSYYVMKGRAEVCIGDQCGEIKERSRFVVHKGTAYKIRNLSNKEILELEFVKIKDSTDSSSNESAS